MSRYNRNNPEEPIHHDWMKGGIRTSMSETPRTDAAEYEGKFSGFCNVSFARQLERELTRLHREKAENRLQAIAEILEAVDNRCSSVDGPVRPTREEIRDHELAEIYRLAKGKA